MFLILDYFSVVEHMFRNLPALKVHFFLKFHYESLILKLILFHMFERKNHNNKTIKTCLTADKRETKGMRSVQQFFN